MSGAFELLLDPGPETAACLRLECFAGNALGHLIKRRLDATQGRIETRFQQFAMAARHRAGLGPDILIGRPQNVGKQDEAATHQKNQGDPQMVPGTVNPFWHAPPPAKASSWSFSAF